MIFVKTGKTEPPLGPHPWLTRNNPEAERDNWRFFSQGQGLLRLVWDNSEFRGVPKIDTCSVPVHWQTGRTGCSVPGAVRYVGEWICPPIIWENMYFVLCTSRNREIRSTKSIVRLFLDEKLFAGNQTEEWARENGSFEAGPHKWPIAGAKVQWFDETRSSNQAWVEILTEELCKVPNMEPGKRIGMTIDYSVAGPEDANHFTVKMCSLKMQGDYNFGEFLAEDLCYPDHTLVYPQSIKRGEKALVSWWTTCCSGVLLNGRDVGPKGSFEVSPEKTTLYTFNVGGKIKTFELKVV